MFLIKSYDQFNLHFQYIKPVNSSIILTDNHLINILNIKINLIRKYYKLT